ncbi:MAG: hypothetical protein V3W22_03145 [Thermoplasmata archaeon]
MRFRLLVDMNEGWWFVFIIRWGWAVALLGIFCLIVLVAVMR